MRALPHPSNLRPDLQPLKPHPDHLLMPFEAKMSYATTRHRQQMRIAGRVSPAAVSTPFRGTIYPPGRDSRPSACGVPAPTHQRRQPANPVIQPHEGDTRMPKPRRPELHVMPAHAASACSVLIRELLGLSPGGVRTRRPPTLSGAQWPGVRTAACHRQMAWQLQLEKVLARRPVAAVARSVAAAARRWVSPGDPPPGLPV